ncbi:hypothetical protein ABLT31_26500 [Ammoniphilus sp. 3BR4]
MIIVKANFIEELTGGIAPEEVRTVVIEFSEHPQSLFTASFIMINGKWFLMGVIPFTPIFKDREELFSNQEKISDMLSLTEVMVKHRKSILEQLLNTDSVGTEIRAMNPKLLYGGVA